MGNRWEPRLGYFYHIPLLTPPFDTNLTLQSSFAEFFHDILMGSGCPKGVHMQIIKGTGEKNKAEWEENCYPKKAQTTIWSPDYVTCIHSFIHSLLFESLLWFRHWYKNLYNHRIVLHQVTCFCVLFWLCLFYFLFLSFFVIPLLFLHASSHSLLVCFWGTGISHWSILSLSRL